MGKVYLPKGNVQTVFNPQLQHFDFICGQVMKENQTLKFVVVIACISFFLSIGIMIYALSLPESVPVLVTMNDFGETNYIGPIKRTNFQKFDVPEIAMTYQVKEFINLYNTLSTDSQVMNKSIKKVNRMLTNLTSQKYTTFIQESKAFEYFGERTREVVFETEPLTLSAKTYQVDYRVITRALSGTILFTKTYRAIVTVDVLNPNKDDLSDNPLGIYITAFDIKEINIEVLNK